MGGGHDGHPEQNYALPRELVKAAAESEARLRKLIQHVEGGYLVTEDITLYDFNEKSALKASDLQNFLSPLTRARGLDSKDAPAVPPVRLWFQTASWRVIAEFIKRFFKKIRDLICGPKTKGYRIDDKTKTAIFGLAEWLIHLLNVSSELANAIASAILVGILTATKGAFCEMTEEKALAALFADLD
jgi:hypothetical protein